MVTRRKLGFQLGSANLVFVFTVVCHPNIFGCACLKRKWCFRLTRVNIFVQLIKRVPVHMSPLKQTHRHSYHACAHSRQEIQK